MAKEKQLLIEVIFLLYHSLCLGTGWVIGQVLEELLRTKWTRQAGLDVKDDAIHISKSTPAQAETEAPR
jgi:hypothetical protein